MYNFENTVSITMPKGENRENAENWLTNQGMLLRQLPKGCLHQLC